MHELSDMLKRVKFEMLMSYFIYDTDTNEKELECNENKLTESYNEFFKKIQNLYPKADKEDENLFDIIIEFAVIHDNIYFETGLLIGIQIYKTLEQICKTPQQESIRNTWNGCGNTNSLLEDFFETRIGDALEETIKKNLSYQSISKEADKKTHELENAGLDSEQ